MTVTSPAAPSRLMSRRTRGLAILAGITAVAVIAAALAVIGAREQVAPAAAAGPFFPGLAQRVDDVSALSIASKDGAFDVVRGADGRWTLPGKGGYPARFDRVRGVVLGVAELERAEAKTARADWHARLELGAPGDAGAGAQIVLKDAAGAELATLIAGKVVDRPTPTAPGTLYVRAPSEAQTWLARGNLAVEAAQDQWFDRNLPLIERSRVRTAVLAPGEGPEYTLTRTAPDAAGATLDPVPDGRNPRDAAALLGVAQAIGAFAFDDVAPQASIGWTNAARAAFTSFDGVTVVLQIAKDAEGAFWATVQALPGAPPTTAPVLQGEGPAVPAPPADPAALDPKVEAARINAAALGWAFKLPAYVATQLTATRDSLLAPLEDPAAPAAPAQP